MRLSGRFRKAWLDYYGKYPRGNFEFFTIDLRVCRHVRFNRFRAEQQKEQKIGKMLGNRQKQKLKKMPLPPQKFEKMPKKFSIEWLSYFVIFLIKFFVGFSAELFVKFL